MRKTFSAKRSGLLSSPGARWGVGALVFALAALFVRLAAPNLFWYATAPAFSLASAIADGSRAALSGLGTMVMLGEENTQLHGEVSALTNENQALLAQFTAVQAFSLAPMPGGILAGVVARPPESPYDTFLVAAGANMGVRVGMEAFGLSSSQANLWAQASSSVHGVPIGFVSSAFANFSQVTLFSAPGVEAAGWAGKALVPLTVTGAGGGAFRAAAPRAATLAEGDTVFVPGPGMLPLGTIVRLDSDLAAPNVTLYIQSSFNLFSAAWVVLRDTGVPFSGETATTTVP